MLCADCRLDAVDAVIQLNRILTGPVISLVDASAGFQRVRATHSQVEGARVVPSRTPQDKELPVSAFLAPARAMDPLSHTERR